VIPILKSNFCASMFFTEKHRFAETFARFVNQAAHISGNADIDFNSQDTRS
jgi:hypothetical protein